MDEYLGTHPEIRDTVIRCVSFWQQSHHCSKNDIELNSYSIKDSLVTDKESNKSPVAINQETVPTFLHAQCSVIQVVANNEVSLSSTSYTTTNGFLYKLPTDMTFEIVTMRHFDTVTKEGSQTRAAAVQVKTKKSNQPRSYMAGYIVLLLDRTSQWRCISAAFAVVTVSTATEPCHPNHLVQPTDMKDVIFCVWDGYCAANRACDGTKMAEVFHETCRLTYVDVSTQIDDGDDGIRVWDCQRFCNKVTNRYISEIPHIPYAHLKDDPLAASGDELLGVEFAECIPCIAMVTLKVGHPPFLWTDLLTCAKLGTKWYIVHKSSTSEPFLTHLANVKSDN